VNRVHPRLPRGRLLGPRAQLGPEITAKLIGVAADEGALARREEKVVRRLRVDNRDLVVTVPELDWDVHDLRGLSEVADRLGAQPQETRA